MHSSAAAFILLLMYILEGLRSTGLIDSLLQVSFCSNARWEGRHIYRQMLIMVNVSLESVRHSTSTYGATVEIYEFSYKLI